MDTKIRRKCIDELGRLVIPKDMRKALGIDSDTELEISSEGDTIFVKKAVSRCVFCSSESDLVEYAGLFVCKRCLKELKTI
ncbi:MAG: AbrB/MazE/SpoVT family DNA-binding domain-containing protein [Clostridia bacterium]|nr:AbrB/MazE/SpoVT family DNA-binding domain-containing protein [Clostridia bacterium]